MRELRTCDFCGTDDASMFEILPPELEPTEAEQRRVLLCGDCKVLLAELLEPLFDRIDAGGKTESSTDAGTGGRGASVTVRPNPERGAHDAGADSRRTDVTVRPNPGRSGEDEADASPGSNRDTDVPTGSNPDDGDVDVATGSDPGRGKGPGVVAGSDPDRSGDDGGAGVTAGSDSDRDDGNDEIGGGITIPGDGRADDRRNTDGRANDETESASAADVDEEPSSDDERTSERPPAYRKFLRLLRNRRFPMPRAEVEALAASAYDLEDDEVEALIEHTIAEGKLVEEGRQLHQP